MENYFQFYQKIFNLHFSISSSTLIYPLIKIIFHLNINSIKDSTHGKIFLLMIIFWFSSRLGQVHCETVQILKNKQFRQSYVILLTLVAMVTV